MHTNVTYLVRTQYISIGLFCYSSFSIWEVDFFYFFLVYIFFNRSQVPPWRQGRTILPKAGQVQPSLNFPTNPMLKIGQSPVQQNGMPRPCLPNFFPQMPPYQIPWARIHDKYVTPYSYIFNNLKPLVIADAIWQRSPTSLANWTTLPLRDLPLAAWPFSFL